MARTFGFRVSIVSTRPAADVIDLVLVAIVVCGARTPTVVVAAHTSPPSVAATASRRVIIIVVIAFDEEERQTAMIASAPASNGSLL